MFFPSLTRSPALSSADRKYRLPEEHSPRTIGCCRFCPADEQNGRTARIESVKNGIRPPFVLNAQLTHVRVSRSLDPGRVGHPQGRPGFRKETHGEVDALLFGSGKAIPPLPELVREFDFPRHPSNMS